MGAEEVRILCCATHAEHGRAGCSQLQLFPHGWERVDGRVSDARSGRAAAVSAEARPKTALGPKQSPRRRGGERPNVARTSRGRPRSPRRTGSLQSRARSLAGSEAPSESTSPKGRPPRCSAFPVGPGVLLPPSAKSARNSLLSQGGRVRAHNSSPRQRTKVCVLQDFQEPTLGLEPRTPSLRENDE